MTIEPTMIEILRSYIDGEPESDFSHWDQRIISGWVLDAREWMQAVNSEPVVSPEQALDGIVNLCHLRRSHPEVVRALGAEGELSDLQKRLIGEAAGKTTGLALSQLDVFEWKRLSEKLESMILESWESTVSTGISLLDCLDSLECLHWFVDQHGIMPEKWTESEQQQWKYLCEQIDECSSWIVDNAECFFESEFYVERIGHTFRVDLGSPEVDESGCFAIIVLRYISLLARIQELQAEQDKREASRTLDLMNPAASSHRLIEEPKVRLQRNPPFYTQKSFWRSGLPLAAAASANAGVTAPSPPVAQFVHPALTQLRASLILPNELNTNGETLFRVSIRSGDPADSATLSLLKAIANGEIRLGGASSRLELIESGSDLRVIADMVFEHVWKTEEDDIRLIIGETNWTPVALEI